MKILIARSDCLGDGVLTSTFIKTLHDNVPNVEIDILCTKYNYPAFKYNPYISKIFFINDDNNSRLDNNSVFSQKYQVVFLLNRHRGLYRYTGKLNGIFFANKLGTNSVHSRLLNIKLFFNKKYHLIQYNQHMHEVENQLTLLNHFLQFFNFSPIIHIDKSSYFYTANFNPENINQRIDDTILINISGKMDTLRYIPSKLAIELITLILKSNKNVIIIATMEDKARAEAILKGINDHRVVLWCEADLFALAGRMSRYQYFIGADGGLLHLAAGLHMYCVCLFHEQYPHAWRAWTIHQTYLQTLSKNIADIRAIDIMESLEKLQNTFFMF